MARTPSTRVSPGLRVMALFRAVVVLLALQKPFREKVSFCLTARVMIWYLAA